MTSAGKTTAIRFVLGVSCRGFLSSVLLATVVATENLYAVDCSTFQIATTHVGAVVKADTAGIRQLSTGFKVNASTVKGLFLRFGATLGRSEAVVTVGGLGANKNRHDRTFAASEFSIG